MASEKGGSPTSSKTATKTSTKTSTVANPKGNVTVTGGAGDGDTQVTIGTKPPQDHHLAHDRPRTE